MIWVAPSPSFARTQSRRLAVIRGDQFVGMVTADDLLTELTGALTDLVRPVVSERSSATADFKRTGELSDRSTPVRVHGGDRVY